MYACVCVVCGGVCIYVCVCVLVCRIYKHSGGQDINTICGQKFDHIIIFICQGNPINTISHPNIVVYKCLMPSGFKVLLHSSPVSHVQCVSSPGVGTIHVGQCK